MAANTKGMGLLRSATRIAEILDISGPTFTRGVIDITNADTQTGSTAAAYREFIEDGYVDGGEITATLNYVPGNTTQSVLVGDMTASSAVAYSIAYKGTQGVTFNAFVTSYTPAAPGVGTALSASLTLKLTGQYTATL
jgi:hypothetical protein